MLLAGRGGGGHRDTLLRTLSKSAPAATLLAAGVEPAGRRAGHPAHVRASAWGRPPSGAPEGRADLLPVALPAAALPPQPPSFRFSSLGEPGTVGGRCSRVHHVASCPVSPWHVWLHRHLFPVGPELAQSPAWLRLRAQGGVSPCARTGPEKHGSLCAQVSPQGPPQAAAEPEFLSLTPWLSPFSRSGPLEGLLSFLQLFRALSHTNVAHPLTRTLKT